MAELERISKEEEDVELARQANELTELARQQEAELQSPPPEPAVAEAESTPVEEPAVVSEPEVAPVEEEVAPVEEPVVEAEAPVEEVVEEPVVEEPAPAAEE